VLHSITVRESFEKESLDLLHKFRKQTVRRLQHLQDIQKVSAALHSCNMVKDTVEQCSAGRCGVVCCMCTVYNAVQRSV
jgi:hypothetical protein